MEASLCWDCRQSTNGGCKRSEKLLPVEGWTVTENKNGVRVLDCPQFVRDSYEGGMLRPKEYAKKKTKDRGNIRIFEGKEYEKA